MKKDIKETIKSYFLTNTTSNLRVRQIERELKLPLPSVIRYVKELVKEEILKKEELGGITLFSANRNSRHFLIEKKVYNLKNIYKSSMLNYLISELSNPTIILFGSYSKGEDIEDSDIDIYIQILNNKKLSLEKFEKILNRKIQTFIYPNIKKINNPHLMNNIINGITLNGYIEVFK